MRVRFQRTPGAGIRSHDRRGIVLVEMLVVVFLVSIGAGLAAMVFESLLDAQSVTARFSNRLAVLHSFETALRRDVRRAERIEFPAVAGEPADVDRLQQLVLLCGDARVVYALRDSRVTRSAVGPVPSSLAWDETLGAVSLQPVQDSRGQTVGIKARVTWARQNREDPHVKLTFEVVALCAGESSPEEPGETAAAVSGKPTSDEARHGADEKAGEESTEEPGGQSGKEPGDE
ncbi:MAG: prepilin-type N-terminal cleavage/methylation domain-containing protein [Phycisphaerales bacterium]|nr:prepilin-type N-terminal cleavage/methylation domain-containing protein [Phycisphaerales bacterium]